MRKPTISNKLAVRAEIELIDQERAEDRRIKESIYKHIRTTPNGTSPCYGCPATASEIGDNPYCYGCPEGDQWWLDMENIDAGR
jgi:hypothetical protein